MRVGGEDHKGFRWRPLGKKASRQLVKKESVSFSSVHHKKGQPLVVVSVEACITTELVYSHRAASSTVTYEISTRTHTPVSYTHLTLPTRSTV